VLYANPSSFAERFSTVARDLTGNHMLDALPQEEFDYLHPHLRAVSFRLKETVQHAGRRVEIVHFPVRSVLSAIAPMEDGSATEVGTIGAEGVSGLSAAFGVATSPYEVVTQAEGANFQVSSNVLSEAIESLTRLRHLVLRYTEFWLEEVSQTAACNARHNIEARCARWLLIMRDRIQSDRFPITQEFLAMLLGVRRPGVSTVARELQSRGLIRYSHGQLEIVDRAGLEAVSCECHTQFVARLQSLLHFYTS
jgi:CRP-like cAMP-binding protein